MIRKRFRDECLFILLNARLVIDNPARAKINKLIARHLSWGKIITISNIHGVIPFLYYNLSRLGLLNFIPKNELAIIKHFYYTNLMRNSWMEQELFMVLRLANQNNITIALLKGAALLAVLYKHPGLRIMADLDLLIKEGDFSRTKAILEQLGYAEVAAAKLHFCRQEYNYESIFSKILPGDIPLIVEIHHVLGYSRPHKISFPELWERIVTVGDGNQKITLLSKEDIFLHLSLHLKRHIRKLSLKFLVDISELLKNYNDDLDWRYIIKYAQKNRIVSIVYFSIYLAEELLGTNKRSRHIEIIGALVPSVVKRKLIHYAINKYNFFSLAKWRCIMVRLLLFDNFSDFLLYLWRVILIEKFMNKIRKRFMKIAPHRVF